MDSMPKSSLQLLNADYIVKLEEVAGLLIELVENSIRAGNFPKQRQFI
jgi:hypothetical protein